MKKILMALFLILFSHISQGQTVHTIVDQDSTQTLTNKTLTAPTITNPTITGTVTGGANYTASTITNPAFSGTATGSITIPNLVSPSLTSTGTFTTNGPQCGPGVSYVDVRCYGAKWDGVTDDTAAVQSTVTNGGIILLPSGKGILTQIKIPLNTPVQILGTGADYIAGLKGTVIQHNSALPLFIPATTPGNIEYFHLKDIFISNGGSGGHIVDFSGLTITYTTIFENVSGAVYSGASLFNMTSGQIAVLKMSNMQFTSQSTNTNLVHIALSTGFFERITIEDSIFYSNISATVPLFDIETTSGSTNSWGPHFKNITFENPYGGAVLLKGVRNYSFEKVLTADVSNPTNPLIDIEWDGSTFRSIYGSIINCELSGGNTTNADLKFGNAGGQAWMSIIGSRIVWFNAANINPVTVIESTITNQQGTTPLTISVGAISSPTQITSTLVTGTPAFSITSTTQNSINATPAMYSSSGTQTVGGHFVSGTATLSAGSATVTLSGSAVYTSSTSYICSANDQTVANAVKVTYISGSSFTLTGTTTDVIQYSCLGN